MVTGWRIVQPHPIHTVTETLRGGNATTKLGRPRSPLAVRGPAKKAYVAGGVAGLAIAQTPRHGNPAAAWLNKSDPHGYIHLPEGCVPARALAMRT